MVVALITYQMKQKELSKTLFYDDFKIKNPFGLHCSYNDISEL